MSTENREVIDMTANENENNEANSNELNELRESNASLLAEKEALRDQIQALKKTLEEESKGRWPQIWSCLCY